MVYHEYHMHIWYAINMTSIYGMPYTSHIYGIVAVKNHFVSCKALRSFYWYNNYLSELYNDNK